MTGTTLVIVLAALAATPQEPAEPAPDVAPVVPDVPRDDVPAVPDGDTILFKNGTQMIGVQIYRSTPEFYYVELMEGEEPMRILRTLVEDVIYDDIDPRRRRHNKANSSLEVPVLATGERVAPELVDKLNQRLPANIPGFDERDLVKALEDLGRETKIAVEVHPSIEALPLRQRLWTISFDPETTLLAALREDLPMQFPNVVAMFNYDKVVVMTKEARQQQKQQQTSPP